MIRLPNFAALRPVTWRRSTCTALVLLAFFAFDRASQVEAAGLRPRFSLFASDRVAASLAAGGLQASLRVQAQTRAVVSPSRVFQ